MEPKEYQVRTLDQVKRYLDNLYSARQQYEQMVAQGQRTFVRDFSSVAWEQSEIRGVYRSKKDGLDRPLPSFCLKVPTGGGKTFLAVKTIDLINTNYRKSQTGLVLWIVPTTQIYNQTIKNLRDRDHPYRQHLDIASGGRTVILEKTDRFSPLDVEENLVVLMLMLPSASRKNKEVLRMFRDSGGFADFFPAEDDIEGGTRLLEKVANLDTFELESAFWGRQIKTSLGNTLRLLNPVIVLDEGQKAYSPLAQETLRGFNPSIIVELSATPPKQSNVLVDITGIELNREEMVKFDLHIFNKASLDWKETLLASHNHLEMLKEKAREYAGKTANYVRPICLIQVERTGKAQRGRGPIHSEDVREHLIKVMGVPPEQVAVKTSEKDELKEAITLKKGSLKLDPVFLTRHLLDIVPNPWIAHEFGDRVLRDLLGQYERDVVVNNFVFIIEELRKHLLCQRDELAEKVFREMISNDELRFLVIANDLGYKLPEEKRVRSARTLTKKSGEQLERSLFDYVPEENFNEMEKKVAWYLEEQERLFFWYRNVPRQDYSVQAWRQHKIYPDFIFTTTGGNGNGLDRVFVVETKGLHLKGSEDTNYKRSVFDLCNTLAKATTTNRLGMELESEKISFQVVDEQEWQSRFNQILSA